MKDVAHGLEEVRRRIALAAERAGRNPSEVELVAVSKRQPLAAIEEALEAGHRLFGENYVQEAEEKIHSLGTAIGGSRWHLIGHLQKNKVRKAVRLFHCIQTVDSLALGQRISRVAQELGREMEVMVQVNIGGEASKAGIRPDEALQLVEGLMELPALRVVGLMTIHPYSPDPQSARPWFRAMRALFTDISQAVNIPEFRHLSMGMSNDFEVAVEEGATMVRVGTAIFGPRTVA